MDAIEDLSVFFDAATGVLEDTENPLDQASERQ